MKTTNHPAIVAKDYVAKSILIGYLLLLQSCTPKLFPNSTSDTTPPGFVQVVVRLEAPVAPNPRGEFDITSQDVVKQNLAENLSIRIIATAGDSESGIAKMEIESNLTWQCSSGRGSQIIGVAENAPLTFSTITVPSTPRTPFQINAVSNPIEHTGCTIAPVGKGPVNIRGFVRVIAINGNGLKMSSKTFIFDYTDVGSLL